MVALAKQASFGGLDTENARAQAVEAARVWREQLWSAMRSFVGTYIDVENGLTKHDGCAFRLNQEWEDKGRPVTGGALKQALADAERNNFRAEWLFWFASECEEVAELMARKAKPPKTDAQYAKDLEDGIRANLSHKLAEKVIREARAK
jgi:hypothetical protein